MRNDKEYQLCKAISTYLKLQYPNVLYHFDYAGLNLSIQQASKMKTIQGKIGYPDLFIIHPNGIYHGLFLEIKASESQLYNKNGNFKSEHIRGQNNYIGQLRAKGFRAEFICSFDEAKLSIDNYINCYYNNF